MAKNRTEKMAEANSEPVSEEQPAAEEPNGQQEAGADTEQATAPETESDQGDTTPSESTDAPEEDKRATALQALVSGGNTEQATAPEPSGKRVKRTGNTVDFGGDTEAVVVARYANLTVKGVNTVARRGDTITAPADYVKRAEAIGAVRKA